MKREELKFRHSIYLECDKPMYAKSEADEVMDGYEARIKELEAMLKDKDGVMDTCRGLIESANVMSKDAEDKLLNRIKELEAEVKKWKQDNRYLSALVRLLYKGKDVNSTAVIAVANRMDELESDNERLKAIVGDGEYKQGLSGLAQRNAELREENAQFKAQVPKWISVKDRLPEDGEYILFVFEKCMFFGYYNKDCEFHWCYQTGGLNGATHWMPLPLLPTTEESEKED